MWGAGYRSILDIRCAGRCGIRSQSGKPHLVLEGVDPQTGLNKKPLLLLLIIPGDCVERWRAPSALSLKTTKA